MKKYISLALLLLCTFRLKCKNQHLRMLACKIAHKNGISSDAELINFLRNAEEYPPEVPVRPPLLRRGYPIYFLAGTKPDKWEQKFIDGISTVNSLVDLQLVLERYSE